MYKTWIEQKFRGKKYNQQELSEHKKLWGNRNKKNGKGDKRKKKSHCKFMHTWAMIGIKCSNCEITIRVLHHYTLRNLNTNKKWSIKLSKTRSISTLPKHIEKIKNNNLKRICYTGNIQKNQTQIPAITYRLSQILPLIQDYKLLDHHKKYVNDKEHLNL